MSDFDEYDSEFDDDFDNEYDDDFDDFDDYDDYDDELDDDEEEDENTCGLSDYEIEDAGFFDGDYDSRMGVFYGTYGATIDLDELTEEQREIYDMGYYNGAQGGGLL